MIFSTFIWTCIQIWNCIYIRNLGNLYEKSNVIQFKAIKATGHLVNGDVTLCEGCVFDYLTIQWDNVNLSQHDLDLWLPSNTLTVFDILRRLFGNPNMLLKIIVYYP